MKKPSILIFDVMAGGHGVKNFCAILRSTAWRRFVEEVHVDLMLPTKLHDRLQRELGELERWGVRDVYPIDGLEDYFSAKGRVFETCKLIWQLWKKRYRACFLMYADPMVLFLPAIRLASPWTRIGVYIFRALSHYRAMGYKIGPFAEAETKRAISKNYFLLICQRLRLVNEAWFQDEGAVEWFNQRGGNAHWSPTSLICPDIGPGNNSRATSGFRFTVFGGLAKRKGVFRILSAWKKLPEGVKGKASLRMIGPCIEHDRPQIQALVTEMGDSRISFEPRFVPNEEIRNIYENTDALLLLYEGAMVGPSGVLIQAAAWGVPVLATDIGWIGKTVVQRNLGKTVNPHDEEALIGAMKECVENGFSIDVESGFQWAEMHVPEKYGETFVHVVRTLCETSAS
jgi:glycosyltransferase involved in cell wall biosynthesis